MSQAINNSMTTSGVSSASDLGPTTSLQLMFAKLQLELSETAKAQAMEKMDYIANVQDEQKQVTELLNQARQLQADAEKDGTCTEMSPEMIAYMDEHNLAYDKKGDDYKHDKDQWELAITSLEGQLESLGTDTQQQMIYVQDFMGQYNSYLQGANTQISNANQTLTSLARGQ